MSGGSLYLYSCFFTEQDVFVVMDGADKRRAQLLTGVVSLKAFACGWWVTINLGTCLIFSVSFQSQSPVAGGYREANIINGPSAFIPSGSQVATPCSWATSQPSGCHPAIRSRPVSSFVLRRVSIPVGHYRGSAASRF